MKLKVQFFAIMFKANYVNKALFFGVSRVLCDIMLQQLREMDKNKIAGQMQLEINDNEKFRNALSMTTNGAKNVKLVFDTVKKIMGE